MQQNKPLFFAVIGVSIIVVIGLFVMGVLFFNLSPGPEQVSIQVVVGPAIKPWVEQAAQEFNQSQTQTQVEITATTDLIPENLFRPAAQNAPPAAWLAESTFLVNLATARDSSLRFDELRSTAHTSLAWGAFTDKQATFSQQYGELSWESLHAKATASDDFLTIVIASPRNTAEGLAALISATAGHVNQPTLSGADVDGASAWLSETFKENTRVLPAPAEAFATTTGRSIGDLGMLSQAAWGRVGLQNRPDFSITPAQPQVSLDYPFALWAGRQATPEARQAAIAFRDFLLSAGQQQALAEFFLEAAGAGAADSVQVDGSAALALERWVDLNLP